MSAPSHLLSTTLSAISSNAPVFQGYGPLDVARREIRLLDIGPNLKCSLRHASLDDKPSYQALSYYWGAPGKELPITVNNREVTLRKTLHRFFEILQQRFTNLTVWVDVLCINQRDRAEQSQQVAMMGDIYQQASSVYSWLGDGDADTDYALQYLLELQRGHRDVPKEKIIDRYLKQIFSRAYFQRAWVVQECALNRCLYVVCGEHFIEWESLSTAVPMIAESARLAPFVRTVHADAGEQQLLTRGWHEIDQLRKRMYPQFEKRSIYQLALDFGYTQCADPADKIYAFLSLSDNPRRITVDYNQPALSAVIQVLSGLSHDDYEYSFNASGSAIELLQQISLTEEQVLAGLQPCPGDILKESFIHIRRAGRQSESFLQWVPRGKYIEVPFTSSSWVWAANIDSQEPSFDLWNELFSTTWERTRYITLVQSVASHYLILDLNQRNNEIVHFHYIPPGWGSLVLDNFRDYQRNFADGIEGQSFWRLQKTRQALRDMLAELERTRALRQLCKGRIKLCRRSLATKGPGTNAPPKYLDVHVSRLVIMALAAQYGAVEGQSLPQSLIDYAREHPPDPDEAACTCEVDAISDDSDENTLDAVAP